ncbi:MAG TPA: heparan-alpha-glucosaminide N-acetyltransferase domain-containing protein [Candidatus Binatia bacterium]|nr:heparan-alpha-glucosaminide N-acetyltransferase domain-containing protein [Candidatus Binatia bacterium]
MPRDGRIGALDRLRGVVMLLMAVDHASGVFNAGRLMTDGPTLYEAGTALPAAQFLTRWITHLCAPTFVFLAGTALALSVERRRARGESERALDRFIVTRGLFIAALDPLWMSWVFVPGRILLQVLYAIGGGLCAMAALRRLPDRWLAGTGVAIVLGGELLTGLALLATDGTPSLPAGLLLTGGAFGPVIVGYPLVPWLAMMMIGWSFGRFVLAADRTRIARVLAVAGAAALVAFVVVRGIDGYGNMRLLREDASLVQWLHVSKYPPSLAYTSLELGLMALLLAALVRRERELSPLDVLGQTALAFYLLHAHVLTLAGVVSGLEHRAGLATTYVAAAAVAVLLYPVCARYRRYKAAHPDGWARYV